MLRSVICALGALLVLGCGEASIRSQEGHACSTNSSDDPQLICTPAQDLVCIATYSRTVTNPQEAMKFDGGVRQVYVCRFACNTTAECPQPGDICCRGNIHGKTYNKMGGCTPPGSCDTEDPEPVPDAGVKPDATPVVDTRPASGAEGGADLPPSMPDAAATPDAPAVDSATGS
jgi:hypothetical protein